MNKEALNQIFKEKNIDAFFSSSPYTILWFSKINVSNGFLYIEKNEATLFVDGRYIEMAVKNAKNVNVLHIKNKENFENSKKNLYKNLAIESNYICVDEFQILKKIFPNTNFEMINGSNLRIIKNLEEINFIKKSAQIAVEALDRIKNSIKPGISEKQLDALLEYEIRSLGGEKSSFDSIIASGSRGSMPHGRASEKIIKDGELITIDFGAIFNGYCSDITRTFHVGNVKDKKLLDIEKVVQESQRLGIKAIKPGVTTYEIDKICRDHIISNGYGQYFIHSTGHGIGVEIHETPYINSNPNMSVTLKEGMVITVEPGIYIDDLGGVRIEDDVLVTNDGFEILSK